MADFHQNGFITTLHNLHNRSVEDMERELKKISKSWPMALVLPSLYSELEQPALAYIVEEVAKLDYLEEIIIGLDRADASQFAHAKEFFSKLPQRTRILWQDGPRLRKIAATLEDMGLGPTENGKGRNVWYCFGYFLASGRSRGVALHDCDIKNYDRGMVARLLFPIMEPTFGFKFCKGYYYRASEGKLNGRVMRLLVSPLVHALRQMGADHDFLDYIDAFRYPLAGEFSMYLDVVQTIRIPNDWGLEIGVLSEIFRNYSLSRICQVDIADAYDHKHQPLSDDNPDTGLSKMSTDICRTFFRKLATSGQVFSTEFFRTLRATYYRTALDFIDHYQADAVLNGLTLDRHAEEKTVELFAQNLTRAGDMFLKRSPEPPFMPSWNRVLSAVPDVHDQIRDAVEADNGQ
ncbi:MAG TPA: glycosyl transferase [Calditrichia bacterium]|nr:glycosyl transferase [Calditrichia bacterium]